VKAYTYSRHAERTKLTSEVHENHTQPTPTVFTVPSVQYADFCIRFAKLQFQTTSRGHSRTVNRIKKGVRFGSIKERA
jgi:hypothetical protein